MWESLCINTVIQDKIGFLADSKTEKLDLDPFDALKRLGKIRSDLPENSKKMSIKINEAIRHRIRVLVKDMASPKDSPNAGPAITETSSGPKPVILDGNADVSTMKHSSTNGL